MEGSIYFYSYTKDEFKWGFKLAKPCNWHEMLLVENLFSINMIQGLLLLDVYYKPFIFGRTYKYKVDKTKMSKSNTGLF